MTDEESSLHTHQCMLFLSILILKYSNSNINKPKSSMKFSQSCFFSEEYTQYLEYLNNGECYFKTVSGSQVRCASVCICDVCLLKSLFSFGIFHQLFKSLPAQ